MITKTLPSGYGMVQTKVMQLEDLSMQAKAVYSLLASMTGNKDCCFPKVETIAKNMGVCIKTIYNYLNELESFSLIKRSKLYPNDPMKNHNLYTILYIEDEPSETSDEQHSLPRIGNPLHYKNSNIKNSNIYNTAVAKNPAPEVHLEEKILKPKVKTKREVKTEQEGGRARDLLEQFKIRYYNSIGSDYIPTWGRDMKLLNMLLKCSSVGHIVQLMDKYFDPSHEYVGNLDIPSFYKGINRLQKNKKEVDPLAIR